MPLLKNTILLDGYAYPWIQIDFGWTRFINMVTLSMTSQAFEAIENSTLEVRFGYEKLW